MKTFQLRNSSGHLPFNTPKTCTDLNLTASSLRDKSLQGQELTKANICYIKPKIARKSSLKPTVFKNPALTSKSRNSSIESNPENLYTGAIENYQISQTLGFGAYAVVKLAIHIQKKQQFAIKTYEKSKFTDSQKKKNIISEIQVLKTLNHPHIIKFKEAIDCPKQLHIVMEYAGGCSLWTYIKKKPTRSLSEPVARRYFTQILSGINYFHNSNVIHRDIKLENILLDSSGNVKIIDFGFATFTRQAERSKLFCGTPSYMAPEIVGKKENPGKAADIWALGVVLFVMLTGSFPFKSASDRELYRLILKGNFEMPKFLSGSAKGLIRKLLQMDPRRRPTCAQIMSDPWVVESSLRECNFSDVAPNNKVIDGVGLKAPPTQFCKIDKENNYK